MRNRMVGRKWLGVILALGLAALLLFTACAPGPPAEERKVVEIGVMTPATGGAATGGQTALMCEIDYIEYFNEELAIPGVTLKIVWEDTALDPVKEIMALRRFV